MSEEVLEENPVKSGPVEILSGEEPNVTFPANGHDLTALSSMGLGLLMLGLCLSCNLFYYFLPIGAIALGILGLVFAKKSVNPVRTRLFSYVGLGSGLAIFLLISSVFILYFGAVIVMVITGSGR